ncbi:hypothetical protein ACH5RR_000194 [Cinchona calisaya]|uniref:RNase H type-1 domain-containing protein n=1 Tax=Cinchona calisaya TaxID=153742 RepID=A0ABD3B029_9GENT
METQKSNLAAMQHVEYQFSLIITSRNGKVQSSRTGSCLIILNESDDLKFVRAEGKDGFRGAMVEVAELVRMAMLVAAANGSPAFEIQSSNSQLINKIKNGKHVVRHKTIEGSVFVELLFLL